ncbi:MAG TPA: hypothetical protein VKG44_09600 [Candidatus Baltobacteraceae bacterium]|nr:hypothetical protein [Candidatus Baltobacteraceae bacterium]
MGTRVRLAFVIGAALLAFAGAGLARASVMDLDTLARSELTPSAAPRLLGPIDESGRNGWQCKPEQAARSPLAGGAELPRDNGE